jgi:RNA polymerase sigma-70 factor (ECF subfamily)
MPRKYSAEILTSRTNQEWIEDLTNVGARQAEAIEELHSLLLRTSLYTLSKNLDDLITLDHDERIALAEDCAQDALLAVISRLGDFRGESKFTTWAYKFGVNVSLTRARQVKWRQISLDQFIENAGELDWLRWNEHASPSTSDLPALQAEVFILIKEIIRDELTARQRQVLKLIVFDQVPMDVVVERLETNRNAIYKMLHDARRKVKRKLVARGYDVEEIFNLFSRKS